MSAITRQNRLMDPFGLDTVFNQLMGTTAPAYRPYPVDVRETADGFVVEAELPGFTKEQIDITLENSVLTLRAERNETSEAGDEQNAGYHLRERRYAKFERNFKLPPTIDESSVDAKLENGVLTVKVAKRPETKPRKITVS